MRDKLLLFIAWQGSKAASATKIDSDSDNRVELIDKVTTRIKGNDCGETDLLRSINIRSSGVKKFVGDH